jgi:hypothetical protein
MARCALRAAELQSVINYETRSVKLEDRGIIGRFCTNPKTMRDKNRPKTGRVKVYRFRLYDVASEDFKIFAEPKLRSGARWSFRRRQIAIRFTSIIISRVSAARPNVP